MADTALALRIRPVVAPDVAPSVSPAPVYPGAGIPTMRLASIAGLAVSQAFEVERLLLKGRRRGARRLAAARQYAMALVHFVTGRSQEDVARAFKRNRTTASHHMEMVEGLSDVREHEEFWCLMEHRYRLLVELAGLSTGRTEWLRALSALDRALDDGDLEGETVDQAKYIASTFWEDRIGQR